MTSLDTGIGPVPTQTQEPVTRTLVAEFTVHGEPVSKARARVTANGTFTPAKTRAAEAAILAAYLNCAPLGMIPKGVMCELTVTFFNGNRRVRDIDNMLKLVQDALNKQAYEDDSQIIELHGYKHVVPPAEARTEVSLYMLTVGVVA